MADYYARELARLDRGDTVDPDLKSAQVFAEIVSPDEVTEEVARYLTAFGIRLP